MSENESEPHIVPVAIVILAVFGGIFLFVVLFSCCYIHRKKICSCKCSKRIVEDEGNGDFVHQGGQSMETFETPLILNTQNRQRVHDDDKYIEIERSKV